ncbi:phage tail protein [Shewanella mangrovisoli]|uniref:phage tail protein n=1 Tax=Shewanella mangrovisoli TaxID=2864211 RepID=UPI0035B861E7
MADPFIGEIRMFAGTFAPRGWAFCNGQLLPIQSNQALFALIGTTYGGNGQTTFALPNLQGRVPVHQGQGPGTSQYVLGEMAGQETVTLTSSQMPIHNHAIDLTGTGNVSVALGASSANGNTPTPSPTTVPAKVASGLNALNAFSSTAPDTNLLPVNTTTSVHLTGTTTNTGNSLPVGVRQPYLTVNFIIALEGIFPSRN